MTSYVDQLKPFINFPNKQILDKHFNLFRNKFRFEFTKAENEVLFTMKGYAVKFPGVCKMELATISARSGYSLTTVKSAISKAVKFGILKRFKTRKQNQSRQGSTVYQFQCFSDICEPQKRPQSADHSQNPEKPINSNTQEAKTNTETPISLNPSCFKDNTNTYPQAENVATPALPKKFEKLVEKPLTPYQQFKQTLNGLFNDHKLIYRLFGAWLGQSRKGLHELPFEICLAATKVLVKEVNRRYKEKLQPLRNPVGYFNNTIAKMYDKHYFMRLDEIAEEECIEVPVQPFEALTVEEWKQVQAATKQKQMFKSIVGLD